MSGRVIAGFDMTAAPLRLLWDYARRHMLGSYPGVEAVWLLPDDAFPGVVQFEGLPVVRGAAEPFLAFRISKGAA